MFCMNCGAQLSDTAKFCGSCGTKVELPDLGVPAAAAASVPANNSAPAETAQPAQSAQPSQTAQTINLSKQASPAQTSGIPAMSAVSAQTAPTVPTAPTAPAAPSFIPNEVSSSSGSFGSDFAQRSDRQSAVSSQNSQAQPTQPATPDQPGQPVAYAQPMQQFNAAQSAQDIQPMRYSAEVPPAAPAVQPVRKKNRLIPGLCIAAGAVVVLGGAGAAFCHFNKPLVSKLIMGDAGYAHSVTMNALSGISENSEVISNAVQQSVSAGFLAAQSGAELSGSYITDGTLDDSFGVFDEEMIGKALEIAAWQINHATGTRGVTSELGIRAEFEQAFIDALMAQENYSEQEYDQIVNILNNIDLTLSFSEKDSGGALEYAVDVRTPNGSLGNAQLRYEEDGTASLIFPGMSSTGFSTKLAPHSMNENSAAASFDFGKFYGNVSSGLKEAFKDFEIKCENGTTELGTLTFSGMTVQIDLDKADLCSIAMVVIDAARGDDSLIAYLSSLDDYMTEQEIADAFNDLAKQVGEFRTDSSQASAQIKYYINSDNTLAGADFTVYGSGDNTAQFRFLTAGNETQMNASENGDMLFQARVLSESATSGSVTATVTNTTYDGQKEDIRFQVDYRDLGTANVFGFPVTTGTFTMNISAEDTRKFLEDEMDMPSEMAGSAGSSELSLTIAPKGKGVGCTVEMNAQNIGGLTYYISVDEASGEIAPKPGSEYKLLDIENASSDEISALGEDITKYYSELSLKDPLVNAVYSLADASGSSNGDYDDSFSWDDDDSLGWDDDDSFDWDDEQDYNGGSSDWDDSDWNFEQETPGEVTEADIISANTTAQRMRQNCMSFLTLMDAMQASPDCGSAEVILFVSDGEWASYVSSYSDSDFSRFQDESGWTDGKEHWGMEWYDDDDQLMFAPDENNLTAYAAKVMPDVKEGIFILYIQDGNVLGSVFVNDYSAFSVPMSRHFQSGSWNFDGSDRAGVANGYVVGTSPTLALDSDAD